MNLMNLACKYSGIRSAVNGGNNEQRGFDYILGFGVSLLWFFVEVTGIMLKIEKKKKSKFVSLLWFFIEVTGIMLKIAP